MVFTGDRRRVDDVSRFYFPRAITSFSELTVCAWTEVSPDGYSTQLNYQMSCEWPINFTTTQTPFPPPSVSVFCSSNILSEHAFNQREEMVSVASTEVWYHSLFVNSSALQTFRDLTHFAFSWLSGVATPDEGGNNNGQVHPSLHEARLER